MGHFFFLSWPACYAKGWSLRCSLGRGNAGHCAVTLYVEEGLRGSNGACFTLCQIPVTPSATHNQLGPSGADSRVAGLVHALGPCGSLQRTFLWGWEFFLLLPQSPQVFSIRGLRLYFSTLEPWVAKLARSPAVPPGLSIRECGAAGSASHHIVGSTSYSLACPAPQSTPSLGLPATALPQFLSAPPTGLDECFFCISLVVRLPYSSIFCHFWLFFVFKLSLSFFWLCEEVQCVYLHLHLGRKLSLRF